MFSTGFWDPYLFSNAFQVCLWILLQQWFPVKDDSKLGGELRGVMSESPNVDFGLPNVLFRRQNPVKPLKLALLFEWKY